MNRRMLDLLIRKSYTLISESQGDYRHFTWVLDGNKPLCVGRNSCVKTHTRANRFGYKYSLVHSEMGAVLRLPKPLKSLKGLDVLNIRLSLKGEILMSKPCTKCEALLKFFGVRRVYYTTNTGVSLL